MNHTQRRNKRPQAPPPGDVHAVLDIMQTLLSAVRDPDLRALGAAIIRQEATGVFSWAVRSGYLGWTRTHPNAVPTRAQIRRWRARASHAKRNGR